MIYSGRSRSKPTTCVQDFKVVVPTDSNRRELARFLRSRRERVTPADVGLPTGHRRRSAGLRREEVAVLAGLSPTWYTYLEQGRDIHPSVEVLDSLARVLGLTEDERRYMHVLAHGEVRRPRPLVGDVSAREIVQQLVRTADSSPYPVYAVDEYCDLLAWNRAATAYYADFAKDDGQPNMLRWLLMAPEAKERLPDWTDETKDVVARWRAMTAKCEPGNRLQLLVAEFTALSPEFALWWEGREVQEHRSRMRRFRHPRRGEVSMRLIVVQAPDFAPCVVVFHVPFTADAEPTEK
jgi:transcriptional regulator with XRE-family HTH domain